MTSTPCQSAALERVIALWTAEIAVFLHIIVKTILTIAEIVRTTLHETMGRHLRLLRHRTGFLPPSASALHADIGAAPAWWVTDKCKVALDVPASLVAASVAGPMVRCRGELMDLEKPEAHETGNAHRICPHVKWSCGFVNPLSATEH